jgi:hypothetical protein
VLITTLITDPSAINSNFNAGFTGDGSSVVVGNPGTNSTMGAIYSFYRGNNNNWSPYAQYVPTSPIGNNNLGLAVAINSDGSVTAGIAPDDNSGVGAFLVWQ